MVVTHSRNVLLAAPHRHGWQRRIAGFSGVKGMKQVFCLNRNNPKLGIWLYLSLILNAVLLPNQPLSPVLFRLVLFL